MAWSSPAAKAGGVRRILLTGMSGTGKSTLVDALRRRGCRAVDLDSDEYSEWVQVTGDGGPGGPVRPGRDWVWREDRVRDLLAAEAAGTLFVSGCAANMGPFLPWFDHVVLLRAPADVILARLAAREEGAYGADPSERQRVLDLIETVEPLLRRAAGHEIDTSAGLDEVVGAVLDVAGTP